MNLYEQILSTNLINFIIVISTLTWIFKKAHLGDIIDKMAQDIRLDIEKSSLKTKEALDEYKSAKKATKDAPKLQEEIIENAKNSAENLKQKIEEKTKAQQLEIERSVEKIFKSQSEKAKKMTEKEIYLACVDLAQAEVIKKLDTNTQKKLINFSIDELEKIEGSLS